MKKTTQRRTKSRLPKPSADLEAGAAKKPKNTSTLKKIDKKYRGLLENIPAIAYLVEIGHEPQNPTIYVSPQIERISGYPAEKFLTDPDFWINMIHPEDRAHVIAESEKADRTGEPSAAEYRVIGNNNKVSWIRDESVLVKDERGQPLYRVGLWTDITEHKQAELALQQLGDMYRRAIDAAGAVPYILSHDGTAYAFSFIGEAILSMTGYSASDWTSDLWESLKLEAIPRGTLAHLSFEEADQLTNRDTSILWECDFLIRTRDGQTRWIADTSVKGFDEKSGQLVSIGIYQDITQRKLAEEIQKNLVRELEQRNAELERLAYTLSHELKSPLITIRGFLGYLREDALKGNIKRLEIDIQRITDGTEKMLRLMNELIDLMSIGRLAHAPKEIPMRVLVDEAIDLVQEMLVEKKIKVQIADELPTVYGDRKRLVEVFQNLLENSIKFMGEQPEPGIEIGQRNEPEGVTAFYVRDNGIGIEPRFADRIFGIFHKLNTNSEGTGIGLALVRRIIDIHGGKVWIESDGLGKGSTFFFTLPEARHQK